MTKIETENYNESISCGWPKINGFDFGSTFPFDLLIIWIIFGKFYLSSLWKVSRNIISTFEKRIKIGMPKQKPSKIFPITMNMNDDVWIALLLYEYCSFEIIFCASYEYESTSKININILLGREREEINLENKSIFIANISTVRFKLTIFSAPTKKQYKTCLSHSMANFEHSTQNKPPKSSQSERERMKEEKKHCRVQPYFMLFVCASGFIVELCSMQS